MDLSIIIVNWNVKELVRKCIESIIRETKQTSFEVFVVDNNSYDGSQAMLKNFKKSLNSGTIMLHSMIVPPTMHLIFNQENAGFAKANNQALREAKGEFVLFLNPDTEILDGALDTMVAFLRRRPDISAATCKLVNPDGSVQPNIKRHPTFWSQVLIMLKLHHISVWCQTVKDYLAKDFDYSKEKEGEVEQIMGAFFLTRRTLTERLAQEKNVRAAPFASAHRQTLVSRTGALDEDYWLWWEDVEFCKNFADRGWKIVYTPIAKVLHHEGKSFAQWMHFRRQQRFNRGMIIYFKKNGVWWQVVILYLLQPISLFLAFLAQLCRVKPKTQSRV